MTRKTFLQVLSGWPLSPSGASRAFDLNSDSFRLRLRAGPDGIWLERMELNEEPTRPGARFTSSLLPEDPASGILRSCTAVLPLGMEWQSSRVHSAEQVSAHGAVLRVEGVTLGPEANPLAREDWELEVRGGGFRWRIRRSFLRNVKLLADRFPALVFETVPRRGKWRAAEIPGFLDPDMQLDGKHGFPLRVAEGDWYEVVSPSRAQTIDLAPSGLRLETRLETGFFSFAKTPSDGTVRALAIGAESVDRRRGAAARRRREVQKQEWTFTLGPNAGAAAFELSLPDPFLAEQARSFAAVHNKWMG